MLFYELKNLIGSSGDAVLAMDGEGVLVAMNAAAEEMLGGKEAEVIGQSCSTLLCGIDDCGKSCAPHCTIRNAAANRRQIKNYDIQVQTHRGKQWCNISVLTVNISNSTQPYTIHILRPNDTQKRLELMMADFVATEFRHSNGAGIVYPSAARTPLREANLSEREKEILQLLARGAKTASIARQLGISRTTVNNHVQHILRKLNVHSRLEAIRVAAYAGLIHI